MTAAHIFAAIGIGFGALVGYLLSGLICIGLMFLMLYIDRDRGV